jgi:hypothetical protein
MNHPADPWLGHDGFPIKSVWNDDIEIKKRLDYLLGKTPLVKCHFNLPEEELNKLRRLCDDRDMSIGTFVRRAIGTEIFLQEAIKNGGKILIENPDGTFRKVKFNK